MAITAYIGVSVAAPVKSTIRGGILIAPDTTSRAEAVSPTPDSLASDSLATDSLMREDILHNDTLARTPAPRATPMINAAKTGEERQKQDSIVRTPLFADSVSLSQVCWTAAAVPGYGQIYNKQYWKLPIIYGAMAGGIALYINENKRYKPLKAEYDAINMSDPTRTEHLDDLQGQMIRSNTRRQLYMGATIATYLYSLGDAAMNYSTNDASDIKRATTLATICPGAGQIYNKQYWKVPFVVGGFAAMIYVIDWNNRGYQRFKKAYNQISDYEANPDLYPDGSPDEFGGRYTADYMQSLRNSYRRNRDLSIICLAGIYILQIIDAHVDAHFQDYDISDDLSMTIEPVVSNAYSPAKQDNTAVFGFNVGFTF